MVHLEKYPRSHLEMWGFLFFGIIFSGSETVQSFLPLPSWTDEQPRRYQRGINRNHYDRPKGRGTEPLSAVGGLKCRCRN